jgi:hypothetical protein
MRSLAFTNRPEAGATLRGSASPLAKPVQSWLPSSPRAGTLPSPPRRIGTRPVTNRPMRLRSATSRFCTGALIMAAARPAASTSCARFSASSPAAAVSPGARLAMDSASSLPPEATRSLTTGPWRVMRTVSSWRSPPRIRMVSCLISKGFGPSGVA